MQDRMIFVKLGKTSFVVDNLRAIRRGVGILLGIILFFVIMLTGVIFYYDTLGMQSNRDESDIAFGDWLIVAMPITIACVFTLFYLPRYLHSKQYKQEMKSQIASNILSKRNFNLDELKNFTDENRTTYYSNINSVYIDEIDRKDQTFGEENSRGYLMLELNRNIKNPYLGNQKKNSNLSNEFMIYNLPIDEDITKCRDIVNNFLLDKCTKFDNENVASLGYTVRRQRRLQLILKCLLIVGAIGWGYAFRILHDEEFDIEILLLTVVGTILIVLFLYVFRGKNWYKPNYFQNWSEKKRRWHARYSEKLMIIFVVAIAITSLYLYLVYWIGPESIFVKKQQEQRLTDIINMGNKFSSEGNYQYALALYDRALEIKPDNALVLGKQGIALHFLGRYQEAINSFDKALEIDPNSIDNLIAKGYTLDNLGYKQEAMDALNKALTIDPTNQRALGLKSLMQK